MEVVSHMIKSKSDLQMILELYNSHPPLVAAFDTETTGLDIIDDKPFVFQFGWCNEDTSTIYVGLIDLERNPEGTEWIRQWHEVVKDAPLYLAHNVKFDLHMLANIDCQYIHTNLSDTQFYIRFAHDNIPQAKGGVPLGLKDYCAKYVDISAKGHDKDIQQERSAIAKRLNGQLKNALGWTAKATGSFFKDKTLTSEDFPSINAYVAFDNWRRSLDPAIRKSLGTELRRLTRNDIPYTMVDRTLVLEYAAMDIVWVIKVYLQTKDVIAARETQVGLDVENKCIYPLWEMERQGFSIDQEYVQQSFIKMRTYIRQRRQDLIDAAGIEITCNQHAALLKLLNENGINIKSTGADVLKRVAKDYPGNHMQDVVDITLELRTLEKWLSTYLTRFLGKEKIYTQINQVGAASLRMSSDFQQFPNGSIETIDGEELFYPRRAIQVPEDVDAIVAIDYSQIELRVQALYTILVGSPDTNLCRAYMPYKCYALSVDGVEVPFDYKDPQCIAHTHDTMWFQIENNEEWIPVDVHGATTEAAFGITPADENFRELRAIGKRVNFAKNYGAQRGKISEMFPEYSEDVIDKIDQGYYKAFPGVKLYQQYCYELANYQPYATNLFGIRYWNVSGHNLINMLIQGSSATLLKLKIVEMYEFLKDYKTKMLMPIHDEVQFLVPNDELHLVPQLQEIMERWDVYVPIVAEAEITRTYWSELEEMN